MARCLRGSNVLYLNEATMIDIVQEWLDEKFLEASNDLPRVTSVKQVSEAEHLDMFRIELSGEGPKSEGGV